MNIPEINTTTTHIMEQDIQNGAPLHIIADTVETGTTYPKIPYKDFTCDFSISNIKLTLHSLHPYHPHAIHKKQQKGSMQKSIAFHNHHGADASSLVASSMQGVQASMSTLSMAAQSSSSAFYSGQPQPLQGTFFNLDSRRFFQNHPFRMAVFPLVTRHPTDLYAIGLDVARHIGYRDTYTMFRRYGEVMPKFWASEHERSWMAEHGILTPVNKYREIALVRVTQALDVFGVTLLQPECSLPKAIEFTKQGIALSHKELTRLENVYDHNLSHLESIPSELNSSQSSSSSSDTENEQENKENLPSNHFNINSALDPDTLSKTISIELPDNIMDSFERYNQQVMEIKSALNSWFSYSKIKSIDMSISLPKNVSLSGNPNVFPLSLMKGQYQNLHSQV